MIRSRWLALLCGVVLAALGGCRTHLPLDRPTTESVLALGAAPEAVEPTTAPTGTLARGLARLEAQEPAPLGIDVAADRLRDAVRLEDGPVSGIGALPIDRLRDVVRYTGPDAPSGGFLDRLFVSVSTCVPRRPR